MQVADVQPTDAGRYSVMLSGLVTHEFPDRQEAEDHAYIDAAANQGCRPQEARDAWERLGGLRQQRTNYGLFDDWEQKLRAKI